MLKFIYVDQVGRGGGISVSSKWFVGCEARSSSILLIGDVTCRIFRGVFTDSMHTPRITGRDKYAVYRFCVWGDAEDLVGPPEGRRAWNENQITESQRYKFFMLIMPCTHTTAPATLPVSVK